LSNSYKKALSYCFGVQFGKVIIVLHMELTVHNRLGLFIMFFVAS